MSIKQVGCIKNQQSRSRLTPQGLEPVPHLIHHSLLVVFLVLQLGGRGLGGHGGTRHGAGLLHLALEDLAEDPVDLAVGGHLLVLEHGVLVEGQVLADHLLDDAGLDELEAQLLHGVGELGQAHEAVDVAHDAHAGLDAALDLAHGEGLVHLHLHAAQLGLGGHEPRRRPPRADQLAREVPRLPLRLGPPRGVSRAPPVRRHDQVLRLLLDLPHGGDVAVELAEVRADELVALAHLRDDGGGRVRQPLVLLLSGGRRSMGRRLAMLTWALGSGLANMALRVSILEDGLRGTATWVVSGSLAYFDGV